MWSWLVNALPNWKTGVTGIIAGAVVVGNALGVLHVTPEQQVSIIGGALVLIGLFAKDSNVDGTAETKGEDQNG